MISRSTSLALTFACFATLSVAVVAKVQRAEPAAVAPVAPVAAQMVVIDLPKVVVTGQVARSVP